MSGSVLADTPHIAIVGLGLIGGSIARGLRAAGYAGTLTGAVASPEDAARALELGLVDRCHTQIGAALTDADLIVVATPPSTLEAVFAEVAAHRPEGAVVTDTASSKASVIAVARRVFDAAALADFVPGHPIAGTENNGLEAGFAGLFCSRRVLLTPHATTRAEALARVETLWAALGAETVRMDAAHHDEVLAATSHLPHVLAYTLVDTLAAMDERTEVFAYAAGGFADFTRIASSDAGLWLDIVAANRDPVLDTLDIFMDRLQHTREAIAAGDDRALHEIFQRAQAAREQFASRRESDNHERG